MPQQRCLRNTRSKWRGIGDYQTWYQWKIRGDRTCYDENITYQTSARIPGAYDYALLANEARAMSGEDDLYTRLELDLIKNRLDPDLYPDVNWIDEIMKRNSIQQNYYVSAKEEVTLPDTSCRWGIRMKEPPIAKRKICLKSH